MTTKKKLDWGVLIVTLIIGSFSSIAFCFVTKMTISFFNGGSPLNTIQWAIIIVAGIFAFFSGVIAYMAVVTGDPRPK